MAYFNNSNLSIDLKAQDLLREWFSKRGLPDNAVISCLGLGDSDVHYEMTQQATRIKVLQAPYATPRIKHHLYYSGVTANITGNITTFLRRVNEFNQIESLYNYPPNNTTYTAGITPPTLANGFNFSTIDFDQTSLDKEGFIVYFQTIPDNYFDTNGIPQRLVEQYDFTFNNVPASWEVILDQTNGSFLIAKPDLYTFALQQGSITITGLTSAITRTILYNF